jgi:glycine oxidase
VSASPHTPAQPMPPLDVIVVGAGALGLATAAELTARGHSVAVIDPGGDNASSVAAGMIAPAFESALEGLDDDGAVLLRSARAIWPTFAARHGIVLHEDGALWCGPDREAMAVRLKGLGFDCQHTDDGVLAPLDARLSPVRALAALSGHVTVVRAEVRAIRRLGVSLWCVDEQWTARHLVIATGHGCAIEGLPPLARTAMSPVVPIKGQIVMVQGAPVPRTVRGPGIYLVPGDGHTMIGASMEEGAEDKVADPAVTRSLLERAEALTGQSLTGLVHSARCGVRAAMPDRLPLAGHVEQGLCLALAPRRNGWLLAPAVAGTVADAIEQRPPGPFSQAFNPLRSFHVEP